MHVRLLSYLPLCVVALGLLAADPETAVVISPLNKPMDFSYQAWQDKVVIAAGTASLNKLPANGGGGWNALADLGGHGDDSPALRLRTRAGNTAKVMTLIMDDTAGRTARWEFPLPAPSEEFVLVTPKGGASLKEPNTLQNKKNPDDTSPLDLPHIRQYQILGDWSKTVYDVEVDAIVVVRADAAIRAEREAHAKERAAEAERQAKLAADEAERVAKEHQKRIWWHGKRTERSPKVEHVSLAAPDILAITIRAQHVVQPVLSKYEPQEGDEKKVEKWKDGTLRRARLIREGKNLGWLMGPKLDWFATYEKLEGDPLLEFLVEDASLYTLSSKDDAAFGPGVKPTVVYRKSKPVDWQLPWGKDFPMRHTAYLKMAKPFVDGKTYTITIDKLNVQNGDLTFKADLANVRSDTVHVNQIGYRPDDPAKHAFLSVWLGTGDGCELPEGLPFSILRDDDGQPVFSGKAERVMGVHDTEVLCSKPPKNYSRTDVHRLDFSSFQTPGTYRIYVSGIGCSYPFEIGDKVWEKAFLIQMKGLYNNRSTELGPPYSAFRKPRDFYPADGASVTRSTWDMLANAKTSGLAEGDTGEPVPDAWGGYHDAGDWNPRRVSHMSVTLAQLEIFELFPEYMGKLDLNIPPMEGVPDLITEALFEIDCFRRLQLPDGGIPYGIESDGDPSPGEISWLSMQRVYVSAPNIRDSWFYAAVAARAAKLLRPYRPELAKTYLDSAARAFAWAEKDYAARKADGRLEEYKSELWRGINARNLSALALYDCTADKAYHAVFMEDTVLKDESPETNWWAKHIQLDAAFLYARLDDAKADPEIKKHALVAVTKQADRAIAYAEANTFNLTTHDRYRPMFGGFFSTSGGTEIARAHYLTGKPEYLAALVRSCQFQSGCNPNNIVYTTGLGANPVKNPLHLDSRSSGQAVPVGLTTFGNVDYWNNKGGFWDWPITSKLKDPMACWPNPYDWPLTEAYFDIFLFVSMNEFVVDTWAPNVLVWGYLAARAPSSAQ
jgi:endoglucanase